MKKLQCQKCPKQFRTQNGLAWHMSHGHKSDDEIETMEIIRMAKNDLSIKALKIEDPQIALKVFSVIQKIDSMAGLKAITDIINKLIAKP